MNEPRVIGGRYKIEKLLGEGGIGFVYYGTDQETNEPVAIKSLKPHIVENDPEIVERFRREGEALRELNHPNIVKMLATVEENDQSYIVMEYVEGGSLYDLLQQEGKLPIERVLLIALDLCDALTRAHRLKIIHRDIKPANVLLAADGTPRLTDFGAARHEKRQDLTKQGWVLGTISYLSPEACRGARLDARTDIWSFGVMLFEMLSGERPFDEDEVSATIISIATSPLPDLVAMFPDAPSGLVSLIYKMLEKDRDKRIPSMRQVGAELESIIEHADTGVRQALDLIYRMLEKDRDKPISRVRLVGGKLESLSSDPGADISATRPAPPRQQLLQVGRFEASNAQEKPLPSSGGGGSALEQIMENRLLVGAALAAVIVIVLLIVLVAL